MNANVIQKKPANPIESTQADSRESANAVQKKGLRGMSFDEGEAALAPVQMATSQVQHRSPEKFAEAVVHQMIQKVGHLSANQKQNLTKDAVTAKKADEKLEVVPFVLERVDNYMSKGA